VTPDDLVQSIAQVACAFDQPFGNSSALPAYCCALQARRDGVTRMLAGDGGDELFGGNSRYATQKIFAPYAQLPQALRQGVLEPFFKLGLVSRTPLLKKGTGYIRQANTPLPDRMQMFNLLLRLGMDKVLTPSFLRYVDPSDVLRQQRAVWASAQADNDLDRMLAYDWRYTLAESDLPKVRVSAQLAGMAVGFPLLDDRLVAFSSKLPVNFKLRGMKLRWFFKEALRGFLPEEIITKRKQGFGLPFGVWTTRHAALRDLARDSLDGIGKRGIVQMGFVDSLLQQHLPEHPGYYGEMVWILMMLEQWLRHHQPQFRLD
jgi:asparagine synthase (glutamine-hydrolysing)